MNNEKPFTLGDNCSNGGIGPVFPAEPQPFSYGNNSIPGGPGPVEQPVDQSAKEAQPSLETSADSGDPSQFHIDVDAYPGGRELLEREVTDPSTWAADAGEFDRTFRDRGDKPTI